MDRRSVEAGAGRTGTWAARNIHTRQHQEHLLSGTTTGRRPRPSEADPATPPPGRWDEVATAQLQGGRRHAQRTMANLDGARTRRLHILQPAPPPAAQLRPANALDGSRPSHSSTSANRRVRPDTGQPMPLNGNRPSRDAASVNQRPRSWHSASQCPSTRTGPRTARRPPTSSPAGSHMAAEAKSRQHPVPAARRPPGHPRRGGDSADWRPSVRRSAGAARADTPLRAPPSGGGAFGDFFGAHPRCRGDFRLHDRSGWARRFRSVPGQPVGSHHLAFTSSRDRGFHQPCEAADPSNVDVAPSGPAVSTTLT